jgi:hypothetical protein
MVSMGKISHNISTQQKHRQRRGSDTIAKKKGRKSLNEFLELTQHS